MAEEVAEVVAIVRADTGDYEREMRKADRTARTVQKQNQASDRANVDGANRTAAALGRVRLGWLGVAGAIGLANNFLSRGPLASALSQQRGAALDRISDQLFRGTGLSDLSQATNKRLFDVARGLRATRNADPTGEGNLAIGAVETARQKVVGIGTTPFDEGFQRSAMNADNAAQRQRFLIEGAGMFGRGLLRGAVGQAEAGIRDMETGRGLIAGTRVSSEEAARLRVEVTLNTGDTMQGALSAAFQDPEVQRALQRALQDQVRQNLAGALP